MPETNIPAKTKAASFQEASEKATQALQKISAGESLSFIDSMQLMDSFAAAKVSEVKIAALLSALATKGESSDELAGFAASLRKNALSLTLADKNETADICGTGGDHKGMFNISTAAALVAAGAGLPIVKHGNRSVSSNSGSADVLETLGVNLMLNGDTATKVLRHAGIVFLFAPVFHPAMKHVAALRKELGVRTLFNLIGPLSNPAAPAYQLLGVYNQTFAEALAGALQKLPLRAAMVVYAQDGSDEIVLHCPSHVIEVSGESLQRYQINPKSLGLYSANTSKLKVQNKQESAAIIQEILANKRKDVCRDIVLLNAAALLQISNKAASLEAGLVLAEKALESGQVAEKLQRLIAFSNSCTAS